MDPFSVSYSGDGKKRLSTYFTALPVTFHASSSHPTYLFIATLAALELRNFLGTIVGPSESNEPKKPNFRSPSTQLSASETPSAFRGPLLSHFLTFSLYCDLISWLNAGSPPNGPWQFVAAQGLLV